MSKTDSDDDFTEFAGTVFWPRGTADLTDTTRCPACHSQLHSPVCSNCALDLRHPAAALLLTASTDAAASLSHRTALIGRIRFDVAEAQAQAADLVASRAPLAASVPESAPVSVPVAMRMPPPAAQAPAPALTPRAQRPPSAPGAGATVSVPGAPRRSSVQILLLLVGVTLVSVAAIFFLTVAWIYAGLEVRSAIIALITAAALVTAGVLRRKRLVATAEGIGALAVVLVLLDAWALRQNDLFGLASADGPAYWGVTLVSCTVLFLFWHAVSGLRVASVAGFAAAAPGLGLLAAGLAAGQDGTTRLFVGLLGAAVGALLHPLTLPRGTADGSTGARPGPTSTTPAAPVPHRFWPAVDRVPERAAILVLGGMALVGAALTATVVAPDSTLAPLVTLGAVTVAALLHQLLFVQRATPGSAYAAFASGCAALTALALTAIAPLVAYRADNLTLALTVPILVAGSIPLAVEVYARRRSAGPARTAAIAGGATAALVAAGFAVLVVISAAIPLLGALTSGLAGIGTGTGTGTTLPPIRTDSVWALGTLAAVGLLATLAWLIGGILTDRRRVLAALFMAIAVLGVPFSGSLLPITLLYVLLGTISLAALVLARRGRLSLGVFTPVVVAFFVLTESLGYLVSWQSSTTWWIGSLAAIAALLGTRLLIDRGTATDGAGGNGNEAGAVPRGLLLAGAITLTLVAAVAAPWMLTLGAAPSVTALSVDCLRALALATALLQLLVVLPRPALLTVSDRRWAFWTLLAPTVFVFALPVTVLAESLSAAERAALLQGAPATGIVHALVLLTALLLWLLVPANRDILARERLVAAIGVAPVLWLLVWSVARITPATPDDRILVIPAAALVAGALGLTLGLLRGRSRDRLALETGAALVLVPGTIWALAAAQPLGWLLLLLAGIAALLTSIAADGLFGSRSPRRHLGWLALALGTAGLWLGLARSGTAALEPYLLPVAGMLLLLAALLHRFGRVERATTASPGAALLAFAGLLVAIVPLALASDSGSLPRAVLVAAASAVLLLGAGFIRWMPRRSAYLAAAAAAGAIGLVLTSVVQAGAVLGAPGAPDARLEYWLLPLAAVIGGAFLLTAQTDAASRRPRRLAGVTLVLLALSLVTLAEINAFAWVDADDEAVAGLRASSLVVALSVVHVLALRRPRAPLTVSVGGVAVALAGLAMVGAVQAGAVDPIELVTVPVGLALVVGRLLAARPGAGGLGGAETAASPGAARSDSWWIALGLGIALLPSAVAGVSGTTGTELVRPVLVLALAGALAVAGARLSPRPRWSAAAWPALGVGVLGVVITVGGRIPALLAQTPLGPDTRLEAWLLPGALLVVAVGTSLVAGIRRAAADTGTEPATDAAGLRLGYGLVMLAIVGILAAEVLALDFAPLAPIRVILVVWTFSALHLAAFWYDDSRLGRMVAWVAITAGAATVVAGFAQSAPDTVEIVSVPLAIALLASGRLHLDAVPRASSWPWLAPGLLVLLVPSLLLDITASPLWRVVGLGVLALVVIVVGVQRKLQAPFLIGAAVLLVHALAQLWPWISAAYGAVPWWLWLGVGGVILIVLAARYEQRIANLKSIALSISALR